MGSLYERFVMIISKWPDPYNLKILSYGNILRQKLNNRNILGNIFPGSGKENAEKLESLARLLKNVYGTKYPCTKEVGASGLELKTLESTLASEFAMHFSHQKT